MYQADESCKCTGFKNCPSNIAAASSQAAAAAALKEPLPLTTPCTTCSHTIGTVHAIVENVATEITYYKIHNLEE
jgi:hypothetical protein